MVVTIVIWVGILWIGIWIGIIVGATCGLSLNSSDGIINRLYEELEESKAELAALECESCELSCESDECERTAEEEGEWWKIGDSNPLGECSY